MAIALLRSIARQARDGVREARVEMILARGDLRLVGRLHHGFRARWVESLDEKFAFEIDLEGKDGNISPTAQS